MKDMKDVKVVKGMKEKDMKKKTRKISSRDMKDKLAGVPDWTFRKNALIRRLTFPAFADAVAFITRLAFEAEAADHHPDLTVSYKRVTVTWTTHSEGGVTEKDFAGAAQSDRIAKAFGA